MKVNFLIVPQDGSSFVLSLTPVSGAMGDSGHTLTFADAADAMDVLNHLYATEADKANWAARLTRRELIEVPSSLDAFYRLADFMRTR